jgi:hypothetical protein
VKKRAALLAFLVAAAAAAAAEDVPNDDAFATALASGDLSIGIRARYEFVGQDGFDKKANATTTRLRLNYKTGSWRDLSAFAEFDHVFNILLTDYNSGAGTSPNKGEYPVIADPDGSDLNQLYLDYGFDPAWNLRLGRQRIVLDNQRFVGGVGWRQNEQTYDAVSATTTALENTTIFYSYIGQVRRVFGQTVSAGKANVNTHLLNGKYEINDDWSVTPYAYLIDDDDTPEFSTSTIGARLDGSLPLLAGKLTLLAEFATQSDYGNAPVSFNANYYHLTATWTDASGLSFGLGLESLGGNSDPGEAFRTPLATLHAFNGWADKFLTTPAAGLRDTYLSAMVPFGQWKITAVYHDFAAETGSGDYGNEIDFSASRKLTERYGLLLKAAFFSGDSASAFADTTKIWMMLTANY